MSLKVVCEETFLETSVLQKFIVNLLRNVAVSLHKGPLGYLVVMVNNIPVSNLRRYINSYFSLSPRRILKLFLSFFVFV